MIAAFAAEPAGRLRASVVHIRVGDTSGGAGVVWPGGIVVTNAHVATEREVTLILPDGSITRGETAWRDPARDLAAVTAPGLAGLPPAEPGDPMRLRAGALVFAIGHPWGIRDAGSVGVFHRVGPVAESLGVPEPVWSPRTKSRRSWRAVPAFRKTSIPICAVVGAPTSLIAHESPSEASYPASAISRRASTPAAYQPFVAA